MIMHLSDTSGVISRCWLKCSQSQIFLLGLHRAEKFLRKFRCHRPMLWEVDQKVKEAADALHPSSNVDLMQNILQDTLIHCWELLLKRHSATMQIDAKFQDLLFRALD